MNLKSNPRHRRGVSETIGTMMILIVTVAGAVFISNAMQTSLFDMESNPESNTVRTDSIKLTGYDSRDSVDLSDISDLSNSFDQILCTDSCSGIGVTDKRPLAGGTDFIVLHIRNTGINPVFLHGVSVNEITHPWDVATSNVVLDVTGDAATTGEFPADGSFSIVPYSNDPPITQRGDNIIQGDQEVRLIVKLSENISQDVGMWDSMRVFVNFGGPQPSEFIVLSGDAKW